jgi:hypothetical protein
MSIAAIYTSSYNDQIKEDLRGRACSTDLGKEENKNNAYRILVEMSEV